MFKSICKNHYSLSYSQHCAWVSSKNINSTPSIIEIGKEYSIYPIYNHRGMLLHYDIYDKNIPIMVYGITMDTIDGLSVSSLLKYFYSKEEMRDIKLEEILR